MKTKILVSLIALLAVMAYVQLAGVLAVGDLNVSSIQANVNGVDMGSKTVVNYAGATLVVRTEFVVNQDYSNADSKVRVWIGGKETEASVKDIALTTGTHYEYLVLKVPTDIDSTETVSLYVRVESGSDYQEAEFNLKLQRKTYSVDILSVDYDRTVKAGENLPVTIVLSNDGYRELKNLFAIVSIDELGISKKVYFNDLIINDTCNKCDKEDSAERTVTLKIPTNAKAGEYQMKVEALNSKQSSFVTKVVVVAGSEEESRIVVPVTSKDFTTGDSVTYDVVIVNSGSKVGVYEIVPETTSGLSVSTDTPIVTVAAGSSQTVKVAVKASRDGAYTFAVNVNSDGQLVQRASLTANVDAGNMFSGNVAILTIILAIVFVVLLVVLVVLLTRKPMKSEELEESYY
jgi:hypothetical protein